MLIEEKTFKLKDGATLKVRNLKESDASELIIYLEKINSETDYLSAVPGEMKHTLESEIAWIKSHLESPRICSFVAEVDGRIAGTAEFQVKNTIKTQHRGYIGIALSQEYWNKGIGTILFTEMIKKGQEFGLEQLELDTHEYNLRGQALYKKMGFAVVSTLPNAFINLNGEHSAELKMIKKLK